MGPKRSKVVLAEVEKLLEAGIIQEVRYQTWVANPVKVKKSDGTLRCASISKISTMHALKIVTLFPISMIRWNP
jgi:hypothetical protein